MSVYSNHPDASGELPNRFLNKKFLEQGCKDILISEFNQTIRKEYSLPFLPLEYDRVVHKPSACLHTYQIITSSQTTQVEADFGR